MAPYQRLLAAEAKSTLRLETPPGRQLQIDFGESPVPIAGERTRAHLFVATLGYSRRTYAKVFAHQRQSAWFAGIEGAFLHFGGGVEEVLVDNAKPLVVRHDAVTREVEFNERFLAFAAHWGFRPRACAPYRARTKGKDENGVRYVKRNAIAGHRFESLGALEGHLAWWMREIADQRRHGTTGEAPLAPFERVVVTGGKVRVHHGSEVVAEHDEHRCRHGRITDRTHLDAINTSPHTGPRQVDAGDADGPEPALLRPLAEYAAVAGGSF